MIPVPLLGLGVLALLASSSSKGSSSASKGGASSSSASKGGASSSSSSASDSAAAKKAADELAAQIKREAQEIVDGKRDAFTDDDPFGGAAATDAEDAKKAAEQAAALADAELAELDAAHAAANKAAQESESKGSSASKPSSNTSSSASTATRPIEITPAPAPSGHIAVPPTGYDPDGARRMVPSVTNNLRNKGRSGYDRKMLQSFQTKAGIEPDKIYGGATRGALLFYGSNNPPAPFFPPLETVTYVPPEKRTA